MDRLSAYFMRSLCDYLIRDYSSYTSRLDPVGLRTVAALARTCRAFHEPAVDVLWETIPSFHTILAHTLPADIWHDMVIQDDTNHLVRHILVSSNDTVCLL